MAKQANPLRLWKCRCAERCPAATVGLGSVMGEEETFLVWAG